jgi:hypothetical protein
VISAKQIRAVRLYLPSWRIRVEARTNLADRKEGGPLEEVSSKIIFCWGRRVIACRATLDVCWELAWFVAKLLTPGPFPTAESSLGKERG